MCKKKGIRKRKPAQVVAHTTQHVYPAVRSIRIVPDKRRPPSRASS